VDVVSGIVSDLRQRATGQRGAVPLIGPEALAIEVMGSQAQGQQENDDQEDVTKAIRHRSAEFGQTR
jgi:hypothetical protein